MIDKKNCKHNRILHFAECDSEEYYIIQLACNILTDSLQLKLPLQQTNAHKNFDGTSDVFAIMIPVSLKE